MHQRINQFSASKEVRFPVLTHCRTHFGGSSKNFEFFPQTLSKEKSVIFNNDTYQPLTGTIEVTNDVLTELGVKKGDKVCFKPESEYEFKIDDQTLYRMKSKNITMTL